MLDFAIISRSLLDLFRATTAEDRPSLDEIRVSLTKIRNLVVVCRCAKSLEVYQKYGALLELKYGPLGDSFTLSETELANIALGWPGDAPTVREHLEVIGEWLQLEGHPDAVSAYAILVQNAARMVGDPSLIEHLMPGDADQMEEALHGEPSRPALWIAIARANHQRGKRQRARQLMIRTCASQFTERAQAQTILAGWIADQFRQVP